MARLRDTRAGLLEQEVLQLERAGYSVREQTEEHGVWRLTVDAPPDKTGAEAVTLTIMCPPGYPVMPPRVSAPLLGMRHHQNPFTGDLCLLAKLTQTWQPEWHLAGLLDRQLALTIATGRAETASTAQEEDQGEPATFYYNYMPDAGVMIDSKNLGDLQGEQGVFHFGIAQTPSPGADKTRLVITVDEWTGADGLRHAAPEELEAMYWPFPAQQVRRASGEWVRLDDAPVTQDPNELWRLAGGVNRRSRMEFSLGNATVELRALLFPEEHGHQTTGVGCMFVLRDTTHAARSQRFTPPKTQIVKAFRAGREEMLHRAPETTGLGGKRVVLVGAGAIGSSIAVHLARAGLGRLSVIDKDQLEPGNLARHAATVPYLNTSKAQAVAALAIHANPYLKAVHWPVAIGAGVVDPTSGRGETEVLTDSFADADLVIDASADISVQQYTSELARDAGVSWIAADATPGIAGGTIVTIASGSEACYACLLWRQQLPEGDPDHLPSAPVGPDEGVQPVGCAERTFTGSGFDLEMVSAQAARVATALLLHGSEGGYPSDGYTLHVLTLRTPEGAPVPPAWTGHNITRYTPCPNH